MSAAAAGRVRVIASALDANRLTRLLAEVDPELHVDTTSCAQAHDSAAWVFTDRRDGETADLRNAVAIPSAPPGGREYWIAAAVAQRRRVVAAPDACRSTGLERLLVDWHYAHPAPGAADGRVAVGLLMFKPGVHVTAEVLAELQERVAECGYIVAEARMFTPEVVRERGLIRRHYRIHQDIAERGALNARERLRLLDLYDRPEFEARFKVAADRVPVMPVARFLERSGVPVDVINRWSEAAAETFGLNAGGLLGANEVGDDKYVNLFVDAREDVGPTFLLNPHMPSVTGWYEQATHPLCVFVLQAHNPDALSWSRMRREFCGTTDPARARPGSLRRDSLEGLFPLNWVGGKKPTRANNGIHLSNGPIEALREIALWFDREPEKISIGRALLSAGIEPRDLIERSYIAFDGRPMLVTEAIRDSTMEAAIDLLQRGTLLGIESQAATTATLTRVDVAWRHARMLATAQPGVVAVIATGSVARNRASGDSDLDLVVVTESPVEGVRIERAVAEGITVECEWMTQTTAMDIAAGAAGDLKSLRESSRIGFGLPVYDPHGIHREIEAASRVATPDQKAMQRQLREILEAVDNLRASSAEEVAWGRVRAVLDNLAVVLLSLNPLRYQKPKWVIQDLEDIGCHGLAAALLHAYAVSANAPRAAQTVAQARQILADVANRLGLPGYEEMLRHGFLDRFPEFSYVCRCLADAASLVDDGSLAAAAYTAKFTAGMAMSLCGDAAVRQVVERSASLRLLFEAQAGAPPDELSLDACLEWTERALIEYRAVYGAPAEPGERVL